MAATDSPRRETYVVNVGAEAVAASTAYVLVDLSDSTNFPHNETNWLNLLGLKLNSEKASDGVYDEWVRKSFDQLAELMPARYAKIEVGEDLVTALR